MRVRSGGSPFTFIGTRHGSDAWSWRFIPDLICGRLEPSLAASQDLREQEAGTGTQRQMLNPRALLWGLDIQMFTCFQVAEYVNCSSCS